MILCKAILGSAAVPPAGECWRGEVCAVYDRSVHLRVEGRYLTLGDPDLPPHPYSILWTAYSVAATPGMGCTITRYGLTFENGQTLNFRAMQRFTPVMRALDTASEESILDAIKASVEAALKYEDKAEILALAMHQHSIFPQDVSSLNTAMRLRGERLLPELAKAIWDGDLPLLISASEGLAGFGQGLTPSGDDILAGVYSALRFRYRSGLLMPFVPEDLLSAANRASQKTTEFSGFLMTSAAEGLIALPLSDWLEAVHKGDREGAVRLVGAIAELGHTSGLDCLAGMVLSLQAVMGVSPWTR